MITYQGEQIEVWDAHAHMGERQQLAIHQIPRIMSFMPDEMIARMDQSGVDVVTPFAIGAGNKTYYADTTRLIAGDARQSRADGRLHADQSELRRRAQPPAHRGG